VGLVFGPRPPFTDVFCAAATRAVIEAMHDLGCARLLCLTGAMVGSVPSRSRPMEWAAALFRKRYPAIARDREEQEAVAMQSGLSWTVIKPPRLTTDAATGRIAAAPDLRVGLLSHLSRADLAELMLEEIERPRFTGQRILVRNTR
jgi:putative NADH-flavin reductase